MTTSTPSPHRLRGRLIIETILIDFWHCLAKRQAALTAMPWFQRCVRWCKVLKSKIYSPNADGEFNFRYLLITVYRDMVARRKSSYSSSSSSSRVPLTSRKRLCSCWSSRQDWSGLCRKREQEVMPNAQLWSHDSNNNCCHTIYLNEVLAILCPPQC